MGEVRHRSLPLYNRLKTLVKADQPNSFLVLQCVGRRLGSSPVCGRDRLHPAPCQPVLEIASSKGIGSCQQAPPHDTDG